VAARRALLERQIGDTSEIEAARKRLIHRYGPIKDLINLTKEEKQTLLRALVPSDSDAAIVVHQTQDMYLGEVGRRWYVEFRGVLPVSKNDFEKVVLGGALAVP